MKIRIRYENEYQTLELNTEDTEGLWVCLSLSGDEDMTQEEKEALIQKEFDEQFNKPDYNSWHTHNRHIGYSKAMTDSNGEETGNDTTDVLLDEVKDKSIFYPDRYSWEQREEWDRDDFCNWIREVLEEKPEWAEAIISIRLNGESVQDYAARTGCSANSISQKLRRAVKKLKKDWQDRQI